MQQKETYQKLRTWSGTACCQIFMRLIEPKLQTFFYLACRYLTFIPFKFKYHGYQEGYLNPLIISVSNYNATRFSLSNAQTRCKLIRNWVMMVVNIQPWCLRREKCWHAFRFMIKHKERLEIKFFDWVQKNKTYKIKIYETFFYCST